MKPSSNLLTLILSIILDENPDREVCKEYHFEGREEGQSVREMSLEIEN